MAHAPALAMDSATCDEVDVGDGILSITSAGDGPPLILLHGWTLDHRMWRPQLEALGAHFRLIMPDRRGFGRSTASPDLGREADDVTCIADALGLEQFGLAGLSQGAGVALNFAIRNPDRLTAVALAGTPLPGLVPDPDIIPREDYAALVQQAAMKTMRRNWSQHPLMRVPSIEGQTLLALVLSDYDGRDLLRPSLLPAFSLEQIAALPMPLLAMAGTRETPWRIACAQLLADTAPLGNFASIRDKAFPCSFPRHSLVPTPSRIG
jgi:pimeloyl-ACP methyl ester carboxylesterase